MIWVLIPIDNPQNPPALTIEGGHRRSIDRLRIACSGRWFAGLGLRFLGSSILGFRIQKLCYRGCRTAAFGPVFMDLGMDLGQYLS